MDTIDIGVGGGVRVSKSGAASTISLKPRIPIMGVVRTLGFLVVWFLIEIWSVLVLAEVLRGDTDSPGFGVGFFVVVTLIGCLILYWLAWIFGGLQRLTINGQSVVFDRSIFGYGHKAKTFVLNGMANLRVQNEAYVQRQKTTAALVFDYQGRPQYIFNGALTWDADQVYREIINAVPQLGPGGQVPTAPSVTPAPAVVMPPTTAFVAGIPMAPGVVASDAVPMAPSVAAAGSVPMAPNIAASGAIPMAPSVASTGGIPMAPSIASAPAAQAPSAMPIMANVARRYTKSMQTPEGFTVVYHWYSIILRIFLFIWLFMWVFGEVFLYFWNANADALEMTPFNPWVVMGWTLAGLAMLGVLLWNFGARQKAIVSPGDFRIVKSILGYVYSDKHYDPAQVANLYLTQYFPLPHNGVRVSVEFNRNSAAGRGIAFNYGPQRVMFFNSLGPNEVQLVCGELVAANPLLGTRT